MTTELPAAVADRGHGTFLTVFTPANNSGVLGLGRVTLEGTTLEVDVVASGLTPGEPHPLHLHGFFNGQPERLTTIADDVDRDGFIETPEGEALAYGPVIAGLTTNGEAQAFLEVSPDYPVADANGVVTFSETYNLDLNEADDALIYEQLSARTEGRVLELHGLNLQEGAGAGTPYEVNGTAGYNPQVPVAAGSLIGVDGTLGNLVAGLSSDSFNALALDALEQLQPYQLNAEGTGPIAPEDPAVLAAADEADTFYALIAPSNNSGVSGLAVVNFDDDAGVATVGVYASGLTPGQIHPQHIHGFADDRASLLPNNSLDADADGFVEDPEGAPVVGPVLLAATASGDVTSTAVSADFPVADAAGNLAFVQSYDFDLNQADDAFIFENLQDRLAGREFQIHGLAVPAGEGEGTPNEVNGGGSYVDVLPVGNGIFLPLDDSTLSGVAPILVDLLAQPAIVEEVAVVEETIVDDVIVEDILAEDFLVEDVAEIGFGSFFDTFAVEDVAFLEDIGFVDDGAFVEDVAFFDEFVATDFADAGFIEPAFVSDFEIAAVEDPFQPSVTFDTALV